MAKLIYQKQYPITTDQLDFSDCLTPCAILNYFQDVAGRHAEILNVGFHDLIKDNCIWVILRIKYEVIEFPKNNEDILLETWPKENGRIDYNREYIIKDLKGKTKIIGSSQWVIIDVNTRMIKRGNYVKFDGEFIEKNNFEKPLERLTRKNMNNFVTSIKIPYSYLDHNGHMNNSKYAEVISNVLRLNKNEKIKGMQIDFIKESMLDEILNIYLEKEEKKYFITGTDDKNKVHFLAEVTLF